MISGIIYKPRWHFASCIQVFYRMTIFFTYGNFLFLCEGQNQSLSVPLKFRGKVTLSHFDKLRGQYIIRYLLNNSPN